MNTITGKIVCTDSIAEIAKNIGYSSRSLWGNEHIREIGRIWGEWKMVGVIHKPILWVQKYIIYNIKTKLWAYNTLPVLGKILTENGCGKTSIYKLVNETRKRVGDWVLYKNKNTWFHRKLKKSSVKYTLLSPDGNMTIIEHMPDFCRKNELDYQSMMKMVGGIRESFHGWSRPDSKNIKKPIDRIDVKNIKTGGLESFRSSQEVTKRIGMSIGTLYRLIKGELTSFKGYEVKVIYKYMVKQN